MLVNVNLAEMRKNLMAQTLFVETIVKCVPHVYFSDVTLDMGAAFQTTGALGRGVEVQSREARAIEAAMESEMRRALKRREREEFAEAGEEEGGVASLALSISDGRGLALSGCPSGKTCTTLVYSISYIKEYVQSVTGQTPSVRLNTLMNDGTFDKYLNDMAREKGNSVLETAISVGFAYIVTDVTGSPSSRPTPPPVPPPTFTLSGAGLIGVSVAATVVGLGLAFGCFLFAHTETFSAFRGAAFKRLEQLKPRPKPKSKRQLEEEEESKQEDVGLRAFDLEMARLYRSKDTAFSVDNVKVARLKASTSKLSLSKSQSAAGKGSSKLKNGLPDDRFKSFAGLSSSFSASVAGGGGEAAPDQWERKHSDHHKQDYWRNTVTGKVSWVNPHPSHTPAAASSPVSPQAVALDVRSPAAASPAPLEIGRLAVSASMAALSPAAPGPGLGPSSPGVVDEGEPTLWEAKFSQKYQLPYWRHTDSGVVVWEKPAEVSAPNKRAARARAMVAAIGPAGGGAAMLSRDALKKRDRATSARAGGDKKDGDVASVHSAHSAKSARSARSAGSAGSRASRPASVRSDVSLPESRPSHQSAGGRSKGSVRASTATKLPPPAEAGHPDYEKKYSKKYGMDYWRNVRDGTVLWEPPPPPSGPL
jgi:hypothetical protein